jgi:hypothetical protein
MYVCSLLHAVLGDNITLATGGQESKGKICSENCTIVPWYMLSSGDNRKICTFGPCFMLSQGDNIIASNGRLQKKVKIWKELYGFSLLHAVPG